MADDQADNRSDNPFEKNLVKEENGGSSSRLEQESKEPSPALAAALALGNMSSSPTKVNSSTSSVNRMRRRGSEPLVSTPTRTEPDATKNISTTTSGDSSTTTSTIINRRRSQDSLPPTPAVESSTTAAVGRTTPATTTITPILPAKKRLPPVIVDYPDVEPLEVRESKGIQSKVQDESTQPSSSRRKQVFSRSNSQEKQEEVVIQEVSLTEETKKVGTSVIAVNESSQDSTSSGVSVPSSQGSKQSDRRKSKLGSRNNELANLVIVTPPSKNRSQEDDVDDEVEKEIAKERATMFAKGKDYYCWICHKNEITLSCDRCPRSYHGKCFEKELAEVLKESDVQETGQEDDVICPECRLITNGVKRRQDPRCLISEVTKDDLKKLLLHAVDETKDKCHEIFLKPNDDKRFPEYKTFIKHPMDFSTIEGKIKRGVYDCPDAWYSDVKWMLHNTHVYNDSSHHLTVNAKYFIRVAKNEAVEIEVCPHCFYNFYEKHQTWFSETCKHPHPLVWAKLKGYPFWPAKVVAVDYVKKEVDVRFFGKHDKAFISFEGKNDNYSIYLMSETYPSNKPTGQMKKQFELAKQELDQHIKKLQKEHPGLFKYSAPKTPFNKYKPYLNSTEKEAKETERLQLERHKKTQVVSTPKPGKRGRSKGSQESQVSQQSSPSNLKVGVTSRSRTSQPITPSNQESVSSVSTSRDIRSRGRRMVNVDSPVSIGSSSETPSPSKTISLSSTSDVDSPKRLLSTQGPSPVKKTRVHVTTETVNDSGASSATSSDAEEPRLVIDTPMPMEGSSQESSSGSRRALRSPGKQELPKATVSPRRGGPRRSLGGNPDSRVLNQSPAQTQETEPNMPTDITEPRRGRTIINKDDTTNSSNLNRSPARKVIQLKGRSAAAASIIGFRTESPNGSSSQETSGSKRRRLELESPITAVDYSTQSSTSQSPDIPCDEEPIISKVKATKTKLITESEGHSLKNGEPNVTTASKGFVIPKKSPRQHVVLPVSALQTPSLTPATSITKPNTPMQILGVRPTSQPPRLSLQHAHVRPTQPSQTTAQSLSTSGVTNRVVQGAALSVSLGTGSPNPQLSVETNKIVQENRKLTAEVAKLSAEILKKDMEIKDLRAQVTAIRYDLKESKAILARHASEKKALEITIRSNAEQHERMLSEVKKKQWCAGCLKEAIYFCCWNTSYCGYDCQSGHWPLHMTDCQQHQKQRQQNSNGNTDS